MDDSFCTFYENESPMEMEMIFLMIFFGILFKYNRTYISDYYIQFSYIFNKKNMLIWIPEYKRLSLINANNFAHFTLSSVSIKRGVFLSTASDVRFLLILFDCQMHDIEKRQSIT